MMKNIYKIILFLIVLITLGGCEEYLKSDPWSAVDPDKDIFSSFTSFQGYVEQLYFCVIDEQVHAHNASGNWGDDVVAQLSWSAPSRSTEGRYWAFLPVEVGGTDNWQGGHCIFYNFEATNKALNAPASGTWPDSWAGIRIANMTIENIDKMVDATQEERKLILGQAYFFRAFLHYQLIKVWGGMPYINATVDPNSKEIKPRLAYQETTDSIANDFDRAAELLPLDWNDVSFTNKVIDGNFGRATKGAALALKAKALLYAGSPTMNFYSKDYEKSTGAYEYNGHYMKRAAEAAWDVINLNYYELTPWEDYQLMFARNDGLYCWTQESIWQRRQGPPGNPNDYWTRYKWGHFLADMDGGNDIYDCVTQNYIDLFETANGLAIDDDATYDPNNPWNNRDPRFDKNILLDGEKIGDDSRSVIQMYDGGKHRVLPTTLTPYLHQKYVVYNANKYDLNFSNYVFVSPHIRFAEVYLIYAEAVNEMDGGGPTGRVDGASLTALDAVNTVRARAGMPGVNALYTGSKEAFRARVWNERAVELCFEAQRWYDIRRWHVAHTKEYKELNTMNFNQDHTVFNETFLVNRVFEEKHYWMPLPPFQTQLSEGFYQNPGW